jgi:hypothetical protein
MQQKRRGTMLRIKTTGTLQQKTLLSGEGLQAVPTPGRQLRGLGKRALRVLGRLAVLLIGAFLVTNIWGSVQLNRQLAAARQRGEPLTMAELIPPVPDAQNAAPLYMRADAALRLSPQEESLLMSPDFARIYPGALAENRGAIALIRQAAAMPACRFPVDWGAGAGVKLGEIKQMRRMAWLLRAQTVQEARSGQGKQALQDACAIFRMSEHLAPEPTLISTVSSMALEKMGYGVLAQVLESHAFTSAQAREVAQRLPTTDWEAVFTRDLYGERTFGLWIFDYARANAGRGHTLPSDQEESSVFWFRGLPGLLWLPFAKFDEIVYLRSLDSAVADSRLPAPHPLGDSLNAPWYARMTKTCIPTLAMAGRRRDEALVYRRLAHVALALSAYRADKGRYPERLSDVESACGSPLPTDLFTGQAFVYRREGEGYVLYSVGRNRKDDGGKRSSGIDLQVSVQGVYRRDDLVWSNPPAK